MAEKKTSDTRGDYSYFKALVTACIWVHQTPRGSMFLYAAPLKVIIIGSSSKKWLSEVELKPSQTESTIRHMFTNALVIKRVKERLSWINIFLVAQGSSAQNHSFPALPSHMRDVALPHDTFQQNNWVSFRRRWKMDGIETGNGASIYPPVQKNSIVLAACVNCVAQATWETALQTTLISQCCLLSHKCLSGLILPMQGTFCFKLKFCCSKSCWHL